MADEPESRLVEYHHYDLYWDTVRRQWKLSYRDHHIQYVDTLEQGKQLIDELRKPL